MTILWKSKGLKESAESLTSQIRIVTKGKYDLWYHGLTEIYFMNGWTECGHLVTVWFNTVLCVAAFEGFFFNLHILYV